MYRVYPQMIEERQSPYSIDVRRLWAAVVNQARDDIAGVPYYMDKNSRHYKTLRKENATAWFQSKRTDCGSFLWICGEVLHIDPAGIRDHVLGGVARTNSFVRERGGKNALHLQSPIQTKALGRGQRAMCEV